MCTPYSFHRICGCFNALLIHKTGSHEQLGVLYFVETDGCLQIHKTLTLPISNPSKPVSQTILHAIEELYFYSRYDEAKKITEDALRAEGLIVEFRKTLEGYSEVSAS